MKERKSHREAELQKEMENIRLENQRLKDCILLQQKIIEKEKKQKQDLLDKFKKSEEHNLLFSHRTLRSKKSLFSQGGQNKGDRCLTSRDYHEYDSMETPKAEKLGSNNSNNDSRKTTEEQIDDSMKKQKEKKKLLTLKDFKEWDHTSSSSACLYRPPNTTTNLRRKSYLEKLADQIAKE